MKSRKSIKVLLFLFLALALLLAACGGDTTEESGSTTPPDTGDAGSAVESDVEPIVPDVPEPVTLRFANWLNDSQSEFWDITAAFEEKYPWIEIEWVYVGYGGAPMHEALDQGLAANNPIDVFWNTALLDVMEYIEDLTPFIESDPEFQAYEFNPGILEPFEHDGKQYGLPRGLGTFLIFYNKELLDEFGLEAPENDWTWEDLRQMALAATNAAEGYFGISNNFRWFHYGAMTLPKANGSAPRNSMLNEDYTVSLANDPDVLADLEWMHEWLTRDGIMLNNPRAAELELSGDLFVQGRALFDLHISTAIAIYNDALQFDWDIAPLPAGTEKQVGMSFNNPMFMSKASPHKEEAWLFMKFWAATVEGQKLVIDAGGTLPSSNDPEIIAHFESADNYAGVNTDALLYASQISEIDPTIVMNGGAEYAQFILRWSRDQGWHNEMSPFDYFPTATETIQRKMDDLNQ